MPLAALQLLSGSEAAQGALSGGTLLSAGAALRLESVGGMAALVAASRPAGPADPAAICGEGAAAQVACVLALMGVLLEVSGGAGGAGGGGPYRLDGSGTPVTCIRRLACRTPPPAAPRRMRAGVPRAGATPGSSTAGRVVDCSLSRFRWCLGFGLVVPLASLDSRLLTDF